jgi:hypothetical protein
MKTAEKAKDAAKKKANEILKPVPWFSPRPLYPLRPLCPLCPLWFSFLFGILFAAPLSVALAESAGWINVSRDRLCVTEGAIDKAADNRLSVNVPKMRAYVNQWTTESAELRFTYLGGTSKESKLGSGTIRRQFGLKLHDEDPCNLVYAMWRVVTKSKPTESKLVVSVKRNPGQHTSAECGNRGYVNIKPRQASALPPLDSGQSHRLRAEMKNAELQVFVDDHEVWEGDVGPDAAKLDGPVGIRSDNTQLEFELLTREPAEPHPNYMKACPAGAAEE